MKIGINAIEITCCINIANVFGIRTLTLYASAIFVVPTTLPTYISLKKPKLLDKIMIIKRMIVLQSYFLMFS